MEAVDGDVAAIVLHGREQVDEGPKGVWHYAPVIARMNIAIGVLDAQLEGGYTARAELDGRLP